jgi:hypothetical protein
LARSLKLIGDSTRRVVMTDIEHPAWSRNFDEVVPATGSASAYMRKLAALDATDADEVLFLDSDCLAFQRLDAIWAACEGSEFAVQGAWKSTGHWYGNLEDVLPKLSLKAIPRFNGGMIYYRRSAGALKVIEEARRIAAEYRSTGLELFRGTVPDEPVVSLAMAKTGVGRVIPDRADLMNTPVGLVGRLEMDVMRGHCQFIKRGMDDLRLIRPVVLHAGKYVNDALYWRQLSKLAWLERFEDRHGYGYLSPVRKFQRSVEKRLLRIRGKL